MNLDKLKDTARKYEQKEDWRRAIEVYLKAIQEFESGKDLHPDLSIYNRVGDLQLKVNDTAAAIRSYERAADLYTEQGFLNNAVALCGKILRINPGRLQTYYKLAQIHARKNMIVDAKRNLIEFLERMNSAGQLDEAFDAVKVFADQFSSNQEIRMMLIELLRAASRTDEAIEQLEKMARELEAKGDTVGARRTRERMQAVDHEEHGVSELPAPRTPQPGDLIFLDTGPGPGKGAAAPPPTKPAKPKASVADFDLIEPQMGADAIAPLADLEATSSEGGADGLDAVVPLEGLERVDLTAAELAAVPDMEIMLDPVLDGDTPDETSQVEGLETTLDRETVEAASADAEAASSELGLESVVPGMPVADAPDQTDDETAAVEALLREHAAQVEAEARASREAMAAPSALDGMDLTDPNAPPSEAAASLEELENLIASDPDRPEPHRALGEALLLLGDTGRAVDEFELALGGYEFEDRRDEAEELVDLLVTLQPENIRYYQKRVEYAYRSGNRDRLLTAYLELGDVLVRVQAEDKAAAVYGRVLEHDPDNARALNALAVLSGETVEAEDGATAPTAAESAAGRAPAIEEPDEEAEEEEEEEAVDLDEPGAAVEQAPVAAVPERQPDAPKQTPWRPPAPAVPPARPSEPPAATAGSAKGPAGPLDFVDLGALVIDEDTPRDTRMRVDQEQQTGDEQRDFEDMLAQFKRGIDENIGLDDHEAHYDLGIAFKEMGLLDEAIAEFQKALRGSEGRLRTSEALGVCFFEKSQFAVAEAVLRRAVDALEGADEAKIGLIYWLGRSCEAQGRMADARTSYERAMAVDIKFMDLGVRVQRLTAP